MDREGERAQARCWCRCCWSPSRAGYAARGSRASAPSRAGRRHRRSGRPGGPASGGHTCRGWRTGRHRGRRNSASCRCDWPSATTMSAPISPGGVSSPSETTSVTATISSAPLAWTAAARSVRSRTWPKKPGFCTTTQEVLSSISDSRSSVPSGSARSRNHLEAEEAGVGRGHVAVMRMQAAGQHGACRAGSRGSPSSPLRRRTVAPS